VIDDIEVLILAAGVAATTFKVRAGQNAAATTTFNGLAAGRKLGGVLRSFIDVQEIMA
jgi:hypothetical protein